MQNFQDQLALSSKAFEALQRIKNRSNQKSTDELLQEAKFNLDYSRQVFEEYTDDKFSKKVQMDSYVYNQFLKNVKDEDSIVNQIQEHLELMLGTIKAIYEHINIEPKIYGFKKLDKNSSEDELVTESRKIIFEHLDRNYYNLTEQERSKKYKEYVTGNSYNITINENIDIDDSVEHSYKAAVINTLLENINFPFTIKSKIEELLESQMYKDVFDADTLQVLWENFQEQSFNLSRILSLTC
jgi:hypothetical protein